MLKVTIFILAVLVMDSFGQDIIYPTYRPSSGPVIILPTYRPPPQDKPIIRTARNAQESLWFYQDDILPAPSSVVNEALPSSIDDLRFNLDRRYVRSVGSSSSGKADDQRMKRDVVGGWPTATLPPFFPRPGPFDPIPRPKPGPFNPFPRPGPGPIYPNY